MDTLSTSVEDARAGAKLMYQNDRVLRVMVVSEKASHLAVEVRVGTASVSSCWFIRRRL